METINDILNQVTNLNTGAILVVGVIAVAYIVKAIPQLPNWLIPIVTFLFAVVGNVLLGDIGAVDPHARHPQVRLGVVGLIYWAVGWLVQSQGLTRLEKFLPAPIRALLGSEDSKDKQPPNQNIP